MAVTWDPSDVPSVAADDLAGAMRRLIAESHGLVLIRGRLTPDEDRLVQQTLHEKFSKTPSLEVAALIRFRALIEVFTVRRLHELMLERGHEVIAPAVKAAAELRLNAAWGFNPQKFTRAISALLDADDIGAYVVTRELLHAA